MIDVAAAKAGDQIPARQPRRHRVLKLPSEQATVELRRRVGVGPRGVDPARHAGDGSVTLREDSSFRSRSQSPSSLALRTSPRLGNDPAMQSIYGAAGGDEGLLR